jgi:ribosomal protein S15P/S13E
MKKRLVLAAAAADGEKDDDVDVQNLIDAWAKLREHIRKNPDPEAQKMVDRMKKP